MYNLPVARNPPSNDDSVPAVLRTKSRLWEVILYGESDADKALIAYLQSADAALLDGLEYVGILHDKDLDEAGNPKKPHMHILFRFPNARHGTSVAKGFRLGYNQVAPVHSWRAACRYLVHSDHPDKYQYPESAVFGVLAYEAVSYIHETSFDIKSPFVCILDALSSHCYTDYTSFLNWLVSCGAEYVETFRKNYMIFQPYIKHYSTYRKGYTYYESDQS